MSARSACALVIAAFLALTGLGLAGPARAATASHRLDAYRWAAARAGAPYVYGGTGPGFDCSGLVMMSYLRGAGISLPRTTTEMLGSRHLIRVPAANARRGDLAFFGTGHVELRVWRHWTLGALHTGTRVGWRRWYPGSGWQPTAYFRVRR